GFEPGATLFADRNAFADAPQVSSDGTQLVQAGRLARGPLVDEACPPGSIKIYMVRNANATVAGFVADRPYRDLAPGSIEVIRRGGKTRLVVHGTNFAGGVTLSIDGVSFTKPARVTDGTTLEQRGKSTDGRSIDKLVPRGTPVTVYVKNVDGAYASTA